MYNPSSVGRKGSLFGLPYSSNESNLIVIPVELDVTTSYGAGTSGSTSRLLTESAQLDLSLPSIINPWEMKLAMDTSLAGIRDNRRLRAKAEKIIDSLEKNPDVLPDPILLDEVNSFCKRVHEELEVRCDEWLDQNKMVAVLGGDHSSPLGLMRSLGKRHEFGILQIDAHMDLRDSYEGFIWSHASIMFNAMKEDHIQSLTQVGIRDYCLEEEEYIQTSVKPVNTFFDEVLFAERLNGRSWADQVSDIIGTLPDKVYISFDIDGLDPALCPGTGTPVPGGLGFNQVTYLIEQLVRAGRQIIGFDLCETGTDSLDVNVGSRILYRLSVMAGVSNGLLKFK